MGVTGKYDFKGIKKLGAAGLRSAIFKTPWLAWTLKFGSLLDLALELLSNWLANKGLVLLNVGAIVVKGEWDQKTFDKALDKAFSEIELKGGRDKLTPEEIKAIDDDVIRKARPFIVIGNGAGKLR